MAARSSGKATRAVVYDRVSERDEESQAEHLRRCRAFCRARGWRVVAEHADTASGFTRGTRRPGWEAVEKLVAGGGVDAVVAFAVSRAGRNVASFARFVEACSDAGVTFASATEPIDTSGPFGRVILVLLASLAEMESATKRERALLAEARHQRDGTYRGGNVGFGFRVDPGGRLAVDESEAAMIREAATAVLNGTSLEAVARRWNDAGVLTHPGNGGGEGKRWFGSHVRAVLGAERNVPAILTASDSRRLASLFESRRTGKAPERYMLAGLVRCGICGNRMVGRGGKYSCLRRREVPKVHLTASAAALNEHVYRLATERAKSHPFAESEARDPTDDLVMQREQVVAALEQLGESDLSEHVLRGRERRLLRELDQVDAQLEQARPKGRRSFWDQYVPDEEWVRRYVAEVKVSPSPGAGRFGPDRVAIVWQRTPRQASEA